MPVFRGVDQGQEGPQAPPPSPLPPLPWEEVGQPRPSGGQAPYGVQPRPPRPEARRFLSSLGRALAGRLVDSRLFIQGGLLGDWLRRVSEAPPGSVGEDPSQTEAWRKAFSGPSLTISERLQQLSPEKQEAFRIRRQWASPEVTDDEILRGLERPTADPFMRYVLPAMEQAGRPARLVGAMVAQTLEYPRQSLLPFQGESPTRERARELVAQGVVPDRAIVQAAQETTKLPWGIVGAAEMVLDPLNFAPYGKMGALAGRTLAPVVRLPPNIGVGLSAAYGTTRAARRALAGAPGIPSRARLPIAGRPGFRGASEPETVILRKLPHRGSIRYEEVPITVPRTEALADFQRQVQGLQAELAQANPLDAAFIKQNIEVVRENIARVQRGGETVRLRVFKVDLTNVAEPLRSQLRQQAALETRVGGTGPAVQAGMGIGERPAQGTLMAAQGAPDITPPLPVAAQEAPDITAALKQIPIGKASTPASRMADNIAKYGEALGRRISNASSERGRFGNLLTSYPDQPAYLAGAGEAEALLAAHGQGNISRARQDIEAARHFWATEYGKAPEMESAILRAEKALAEAESAIRAGAPDITPPLTSIKRLDDLGRQFDSVQHVGPPKEMPDLVERAGYTNSLKPTDVEEFYARSGDFSLTVEDYNGNRAVMNASTFLREGSNKAFNDRIKRVGVPRRSPAGMAPVDATYADRNFMEALKPPAPGVAGPRRLGAPLEEIGGVKFTNLSTVTPSQQAKFIAMVTDNEIRKSLRDLNIKEVVIEPPYKFSLSEQANVNKKTRVISISADAENPTQTVLHELGHVKFESLSVSAQDALRQSIRTSTDPEIQGYLRGRLYDEAIADSFFRTPRLEAIAAQAAMPPLTQAPVRPPAGQVQLPAFLEKALSPQETERLLLRFRKDIYTNPESIIRSAAHDLEVHNILLSRKLPPNDPQWKGIVLRRGSAANRLLRKGETWQSRNEQYVARTQLEAQVAREQMTAAPARAPVPPTPAQPIITEAAGAGPLPPVRPPVEPPLAAGPRWGGPPSRPPGMGGAGWLPPDVVLPGDFYNWRPDPITGQMPPPSPGLAQKVAEAFSQGDPTLAMNLAQLFENRLNVLAALGNPAINRLLRWISREHWNIGRDPNMVTSALQRKSANEMVVEAQTLAALPMDQKLAALAGYDRRTGNFGPAVQLRQGYEAAPSVLRNYNDVVARPHAYDMPESLRAWLTDHQQLYHDAMAVPESQWGIAHRIKPNYVPGFWRPRKGPEGAKARALWEQVKAAGGEHPKLQLGKEQAFEMEKVLANPQVAWENGFEIAPDARTFLGSYTLRSRASGRAIGDAVGEQVARKLGGDKVVQSLREYLGEASNPILKAVTRVSRALVYPILGLDPIGIMASQMPVALSAELTRLPFDVLRLKRPLPTWRAFSAVLPGFISKYPLHGLALLKVAIPRMYSRESILEFVRSEADTIARMRQVGDDPFGTITGYSGATLGGRLGQLANLPATGQFQGILLRAHVNAFKNQSRRIKSMRELFTPEETARFLEEGPLPKALTERLKTSPDAFHDDWALGNHLANVYGGINKTKIAARPVTLALEQALLAPGWARAKIGRYLMAGKMGSQGDLTREIIIDALISYVLIGEAASYKLSGEGMNLTHPDRSDFLGIRIGQGKWINPQSGLTGAFRAVSAPIYRKIQTGKWNFREPVMYGLGQLNPALTMPIEIARDQTLYGNEAITTLSENSLKSRFFYILRAEAPVAVQQFLDMERTGTFGGVEAGLTAFSFNVVAPSQQQLLIREARVEAAVTAGVPTAQARRLARYGANPILAKDEDDKYILNDQARTAAHASAFRYARQFDQALTQDVYDSSGWPTADNRRRQDERMRDFTDRSQQETDRHWTAVEGIGQQFEDTLAGQLTGDEALAGDAFRAALRSESEATRKARWQIDAERNTYVRENSLQQWWKQRQDDGLSHKQREDVARQAFLFGSQDVTGQQQPGILSIELYDHATGRTRYKERDALMAKWELLVGEDTVEEWLSSWRAEEAHPLVQEYWDGLDRYEYYFETRDRVLQKASPVVRQWFDARDKASDTRNRLRQNLIRSAWPAEAKSAEDRMDAEKEYLRMTIPGLDAWLLKFGYRDKPVTEE